MHQQRLRNDEKKVSKADWESSTNPDARIGKMKNSRPHLNDRDEHVVDLDSEVIIHADVHCGDAADTRTIIGNFIEAQVKLDRCLEGIQSDAPACRVIQECVADKGYHSNKVLKRP